MEIKRYEPANWFTEEGVQRKRREIERKGIPNLHNWRFITLTLDQSKFGFDPVVGYLKGKDRIRRFTAALRETYGPEIKGELKFCWKLEFQENGWAHWHLAVNIRRKFDLVDFGYIDRVWGLGRTNVKRIKGSRLNYLFKYIFKCPHQLSGREDEDLCVPGWFADYRDEETGKTFEGARFWQTSPNFYTGKKKRRKVEKKPAQTTKVYWTIRELYRRQMRSARFTARANGKYVKSFVVSLKVNFAEFWHEHMMLILYGVATVENGRGLVVRKEHIQTQIIDEIWKIKKLKRLDNQGVRRGPVPGPSLVPVFEPF